MVDGSTLLQQRILEDMSDGVIAIDIQGNVAVINGAASSILGIASPDLSVQSATIDSLLPMLEESANQDFLQIITEAAFNDNLTQNSIVSYQHLGMKRSLSISSSSLVVGSNGEAERLGIVIVFRDITEIEELRQVEKEQAAEIKSKALTLQTQHSELLQTYGAIEKNNEALAANVKRAKTLRLSTALLMAALFLFLGLYTWDQRPTRDRGAQGVTGGERTKPLTMILTQASFSTIGRLDGYREILGVVNIPSPIDGVVKKINFVYGQEVDPSFPLVTLETEAIREELKSAGMKYMEAVDNFTKAKRAKAPAATMERTRKAYERTAATVRALEERLRQTVITSPYSGVVAEPEEPTVVREGTSLFAGESLVALVDLSRLLFFVRIEKAQLVKIVVGQKAGVQSDSIAGETLTGTVSAIAPTGAGDYLVTITVASLTAEQRAAFSLAAGSKAVIHIYDHPDAVTAPLSSITASGDRAFAAVWDATKGVARKVSVTTGVTTVDSVEILSGLEAGDEVVIR